MVLNPPMRDKSTIIPSEPIAQWHPLFVLTLVSIVICWWLPFDTEFALFCAIASLLIACPCALAIAYPLTCVFGLVLCAKKGIWIKQPMALLYFSQINHVLIEPVEQDFTDAAVINHFQQQGVTPIPLSNPITHRDPQLSFTPVLWDLHYSETNPRQDFAYIPYHPIKTLIVGQSLLAASGLKRACIGLCRQGADPYALRNANIVMTDFSLQRFSYAHKMSQDTRKTLHQNVSIALISNISLLPFTAMGSAGSSLILAGLLVSTLMIISNSIRMLLISRMPLQGGFIQQLRNLKKQIAIV